MADLVTGSAVAQTPPTDPELMALLERIAVALERVAMDCQAQRPLPVPTPGIPLKG